MKSNPSKYNPCKAGFHRVSDFIHHRWISPVEDGFDCVFSVKDNTLISPLLFSLLLAYRGFFDICA